MLWALRPGQPCLSRADYARKPKEPPNISCLLLPRLCGPAPLQSPEVPQMISVFLTNQLQSWAEAGHGLWDAVPNPDETQAGVWRLGWGVWRISGLSTQVLAAWILLS